MPICKHCGVQQLLLPPLCWSCRRPVLTGSAVLLTIDRGTQTEEHLLSSVEISSSSSSSQGAGNADGSVALLGVRRPAKRARNEAIVDPAGEPSSSGEPPAGTPAPFGVELRPLRPQAPADYGDQIG